jgi:hypothetical protein
MDKTLKVGDKALLSKAFTEEEVFQFANISSDKNPIHLDKAFGEASIFGQRIVHGVPSGQPVLRTHRHGTSPVRAASTLGRVSPLKLLLL